MSELDRMRALILLRAFRFLWWVPLVLQPHELSELTARWGGSG